jgi:hypothetical protein
MRGKNPPTLYIPKQDPSQNALKTKTMTTYFKLTLPMSGSKVRVAIWGSSTPSTFSFMCAALSTSSNRWAGCNPQIANIA